MGPAAPMSSTALRPGMGERSRMTAPSVPKLSGMGMK